MKPEFNSFKPLMQSSSSAQPSKKTPQMIGDQSKSFHHLASKPSTQVNISKRELHSITPSDITMFIHNLTICIDPNKHIKEHANLNKIVKDLEKIEKRYAIISRISVADENNPIFQALSTLDQQTIIELESKIKAPDFFTNFHKELRFYAYVIRIKSTQLNRPSIEDLFSCAENLIKGGSYSKGLIVVNLATPFIYNRSIATSDKIYALQMIGYLFSMTKTPPL